MRTKPLGSRWSRKRRRNSSPRESYQFLLIVVGGVAPAEGDLAVGQRDQAMVGDGDAVSVATEILQHVLGSAEGWFGVEDPVFAEQGTQPGCEELGMGERRELSGEMQLAVLESGLESGDKLAAEQPPQYGDGQEEAGMRSNPAGVNAGESAGGNDTVDMGMKLEFLIPGMEHTEEADLGSEMGGIARDFQQRFGAGPEQQTVDELLVLEC